MTDDSSRTVEEKLPDKKEKMSEWFNRVLLEAEIVDIRYGVKGFIVYMPYGMSIMKKIIKLYERELEDTGHKPILFPVVIPESNLRKEAEHIKGFEGEVFWITHAGYTRLEEKLVLRPTSETAIYPLYSLWISSYKDLPLKAYQTVAVYRYETKATRPLIRGREFLWIETHDVFRTAEEALRQTIEDKEIFHKITFEELGIPFIHVRREDFDKFPGAEHTYAFDTLLPDGRVLQIGTTHYLGQKFSRVFEIKFHDIDGEYRYGEQTCFGIGLSRILASLILTHGDNFGLVLPPQVAPVQIVIIPIPKTGFDRERLLSYIQEVETILLNHGYRVESDLTEKTPGEKYYQYDLLGVPVRIEIGPREVESNTLSVFRRDTRTRETIKLDAITTYVARLLDDIKENLKKKAREQVEMSLSNVKSIEEINNLKDKYSLFTAPFCDLEECADHIRERTGGMEVRGVLLDRRVGEGDKCIACGEEAKNIVLIAKAY